MTTETTIGSGLSVRFRVGVLLLLCGAFCKLGAQTSLATLVGIVTDPTGSAVSGARAEVRNTATNQVRKGESDQKGEFTVPNLAPGVYDVSVSKEGFRTLRQTSLELQLEQQARMQFHLQVGSLAETVEVTASVPLVNTENFVKGDVVVSEEMLEMPLDGRNYTSLALLVPGVLPNAPGGYGSFAAINGARSDNTAFVIDGATSQNVRTGGSTAQPNIDSIQEFKMETTGYSAEFGRYSGGVVNSVFKSGGNQVHGSLFEFLRNDVLNARNFFATTIPPLRRNQFGGTIGGPVLIPKLYNGHDRTFFFFNWESQIQRMAQVGLALVPSVAQRQGDFSAFAPIKDPLAPGIFFPNNQIPLSRISPIALKVQAYYPLPNRVGANNYNRTGSGPNDWDSYVIKIDQRLNSLENLSFRYLKRYERSVVPFNSLIGGGRTANHRTLTGLNYTRVFRPTVVNEARFAFNRFTSLNAGVNAGTNYNGLVGLPGPTDPRLMEFPNLTISGYNSIGESFQHPTIYTMNSYQGADTVTWIRGPHLIKFGGDVMLFQYNELAASNARGTFNFTGSWTNQPYADFLLGLLNSDSIGVGQTPSYLRGNNYSAFFQDDWKVNSRLTLNLGLRYELPMPIYDKWGRWTNFIPELGKLVIASDQTLVGTGVGFTDPTRVTTAKQAGLPSSLVYPNYKNFAPRVGFAWRPFGGNRTAIRGGYGIFYGTQQLIDVRTNLAYVFPFTTSQSLNRNANDPNYLTLSNPFPVAPTLTNNVINVNGFQLHAQAPNTQSWNLTVEREIGRGSAVEIGYVGSKGTHWPRLFDVNQPFRSAATAPNFPVPYPGWGTLQLYNFVLNSSYNSGSVTFRRRLVSGFFYRASYSYNKSIDEASQLGGLGSRPQNSRNFAAERGRSDFDINADRPGRSWLRNHSGWASCPARRD